jgi:hypothetical protein
MAGSGPSAWAEARFGAAAGELSRAVPEAIHRAHELALAAHVSSALRSNDAYGATLQAQQHNQLAELAREIDGIRLQKPAGVQSRFELVVIDATAVVLYPWRYATDPATPRSEARNLLTLTSDVGHRQLTIEQADQDPAVLEAELAEEQAVLEQLAIFGRVVTIGYASNAAVGVFDLGWGDMHLVDEHSGTVAWNSWEPLHRDQGAGGADVTVVRTPPKPADGTGRVGRFDDAPLEDTFNLAPRNPLAPPATSEPPKAERYTGSGDTH